MTDWLQSLDSEDVMSDFHIFLTQCGIDNDNISYIQQKSTNHVIFNIKESLKKGQPFTLNIFKDKISDIFNSKDNFYRLLDPMKISFDQYLFSNPKSLFQLLLMISEISSFLVNEIIDKVCELIQNDIETDNDLAIKCLNQLKWGISLCNSGNIVDKLLDLGYVSNIKVKRHIISMLPTVCYGSYNNVLAKKLFEWMNSDSILIDCCLATINQLEMDHNFRQDIELLIISLLDTAAMHTLPAMITFLMKCADKSNISTFVDKVRLNVYFDNLQTMFSSAISSTPIDDRSPKCATNLVSSIKINFQFNPNLQKIWIKSVSLAPEKVRCQSFDLIVLLIIHDYADKSGTVISIFRNKILKGLFTAETVDAIFKYHLSVVVSLHKVILNIVNATLNCGDSLCYEFVKHVYEQCFRNQHETFTGTDIINLLLTEITTKSQFSVDAKLAILQFLAETFPHEMREFYSIICELLSIGSRFTNNQIYDIYRILGILTFNSDDLESDDIKQNITSVIRQQLHNPDLFKRRNGIIGAITVMRQFANSDTSDNWSLNTWTRMVASQPESESDLVSINSEDQSQNVVSIVLKLLMSTTFVQPQLSMVIFDELYRLMVIDEMTAVQTDIRRIITNHFKDNYVVDIGIGTDSDKPALFGLLATEYCDVAVILSQSRSDSTFVNTSLPAQFRLLALCEEKTVNNLKEINALLGCPVILANSMEQVTFAELVLVINWFVEVVNAFSLDYGNNGTEMLHFTYAARLKEIVSQIGTFEKKLLEQEKIVKLIPVQIMLGPTLIPVTEIKLIVAKKRTIKSTKRKSKKSKLDLVDEDAGDNLFADDDLDVDDAESVPSETKCKLLKDNLRLCYRELDLSVFAIMTQLVELDLIIDGNNRVSLDWRDLEFYMNDLWLKTKRRLRISSAIMENAFSQKSHSAYRYIDRISLENFLQKIVKVGPLFKKLLLLSINICKTTEIFEDITGLCFKVMNLVLKTVSHIFNFLVNDKNEGNETLLTEFLSLLVPDSSRILTENIDKFLQQLVSVKDNLPNVIVSSSFITLIANLLRYQSLSETTFSVSLRQIALEFFTKKWSIGGDLTAVDYKSSISTIFETYLSTLRDEWFHILQNDILPEMIEVAKKSKFDTDSKFGCMNRNSLHVFFKLILEFITKKCKVLSKTSNSQRNNIEILEAWEKPINITRSLTQVVANNDEGNIMFSFIKFGRDLMNMVIKHLMPILDNMLRHENLEVIQLLKYIQDVTRFIQRLCIHCKGKKNLPVTSMVPQVRRYLETFMYRVKKMMCINKCSSGILNILPLANKDLHGHRIESSDDAEEDDNNRLNNDSEDGEEVGQESDNETVIDE